MERRSRSGLRRVRVAFLCATMNGPSEKADIVHDKHTKPNTVVAKRNFLAQSAILDVNRERDSDSDDNNNAFQLGVVLHRGRVLSILHRRWTGPRVPISLV
ncbi:hypothetical protein FXO38_30033 [Capsicum annuum]|nr:hypothetical protein FXO37_36489 [Capsicum annuum]KAF3624851.1 hypothetical protein FXO38_30033 [Capsicum annuum]